MRTVNCSEPPALRLYLTVICNMKNSKTLILVLNTIWLTFCGGSFLNAQGVRKSLQECSVEIKSLDPGAKTDDLEQLIRTFKGKRIVAMGEATHGTKEFALIKHRFFKLLVEENNFRFLGLEANFSEVLQINKFIQNGEGNLPDLLHQLSWTLNTQEVLNLIRWMRDYNQKAPLRERLKVYGIDMQYNTLAAKNVIDFLKKVDLLFLDKKETFLNTIKDNHYTAYYKELKPEEAESFMENAIELIQHIEDNKDLYISKTDKEEYFLALQQAKLLYQKIESINSNDFSRRDKYMGDNVKSILEHGGEDSKMFI